MMMGRMRCYLVLVGLLAALHSVTSLLKEINSHAEYTFCIQNVEKLNASAPNGIKGDEELADWYCIQKFLWRTAYNRRVLQRLTDEQLAWINSLITTIEADADAGNNGGEQRVRREFRTLTAQEQRNFVEAINFLKTDRTVAPNKYDVFVMMYNGAISAPAHFGPGFYGFHRLFGLLFETALREILPDIVLPYWDSTLEAGLADPRESTFWGERLFGTGEGAVLTGPFQNWNTADASKLTRNVRTGGRLFTGSNIEKMCFKTKLEQISEPYAPSDGNFERSQAAVHLFVGGEMRDIWSAPNDPLFFLHYAFVDCIWEQFREHQVKQGIDPNTDYPMYYGTAAHAPDYPVFLGSFLTNRNLLSDRYGKSIYRCAPRPRCLMSLTCGSSHLKCDFSTRNCLPETRSLGNFCPNHGTMGKRGYQNSYCADGVCNVDQWAFLPIQIVYGRPPDFQGYYSHPYINGQPNFQEDIYAPNCYKQSPFFQERYNRQLRSSDQISGCGCKTRGINHGGVYIQSHGINYRGSYREFAIVDRRLAITSSVGYVAVRNPALGESRAFIRAYDDCGRICRPVCHMPGTKWYETCTGVIKLDNTLPLDYSESYEGAHLIAWDFETRGPFIPIIVTDKIRLTFYCDFSGSWPWTFYKVGPAMPSVQRSTVAPQSGNDSSGIGQTVNPPPTTPQPTLAPTTTPVPTTTLPPTARATPRPTPIPTPRRTVPTTTTTPEPTTTIFVRPDCFIDTMCFKRKKDVNCTMCINNTLRPCPFTCRHFLHCLHGYWTVMDCPGDTVWDERRKNCIHLHQGPVCDLSAYGITSANPLFGRP